MDAQQVLFRVIVKLQLALICIMYRFAEPPRKMDIRCSNQVSAIFFFDCHDSLEWMLGAFPLLDVLRQVQYFLAVSEKKFALQSEKTSRVLVVYAMTRRANFLVGSAWSLCPSPSVLLEIPRRTGDTRWVRESSVLPYRRRAPAPRTSCHGGRSCESRREWYACP